MPGLHRYKTYNVIHRFLFEDFHLIFNMYMYTYMYIHMYMGVYAEPSVTVFFVYSS